MTPLIRSSVPPVPKLGNTWTKRGGVLISLFTIQSGRAGAVRKLNEDPEHHIRLPHAGRSGARSLCAGPAAGDGKKRRFETDRAGLACASEPLNADPS